MDYPDKQKPSRPARAKSDCFSGVWIHSLCIEKGPANGKLFFTDSTHIKASASRKTEYIRQVKEAANEYLEKLGRYEEAVRKRLESEGKIKPVRCRKRKEKTEIMNRRESRTDPGSGLYKEVFVMSVIRVKKQK